MPPIKIDHVVSFSSEDPVHTANNILSTDSSKKWKCQTSGEKQAIVVLQLEKASQITAIDIGNEHSAYVEVLVSRSSSSDDFKVLLVNSAFMSPLEARQSQNVNKVRMFTKDNLSKPECEEKWDRIKIVCTQPFNRHVQYGLSFITLHSNVDTSSEASSQGTVGRFLIRPESPDNLSAGALFAKRKDFKQEEKPTAAAAIRDATSSSSLALYGSPTCKPKLKNKDPSLTPKKRPSQDNENVTPKDRNRNELFYTKDDEEDNDKIKRIMKRKEEEENKIKEKGKDEQKKRKNIWGMDTDNSKETNKKKKKDDDKEKKERKKRDKSPNTPQKKDKVWVTTPKKDDNSSSKTKDTKQRNKDIENATKPKRTKTMKRFHKLLNGVTVVISGIQNPDRANLRTMALSMGAKYKPDWDNTCTHLICAFTNTPKFNQVKGKGKIVKKSWIETCHKERKRLPWRRFALDKNDMNQNESEDEIHELVDLPTTSSKTTTSYGSDDEHLAPGSDTEERIARILAKKKEAKVDKEKEMQKKRTDKKGDSNDDSTDEESLNVAQNSKNATHNKGSPTFLNNFKIAKKQIKEDDMRSSNEKNNNKKNGDSCDNTEQKSLDNIKNTKFTTESPILKERNQTKKETVSADNSDCTTDDESLNAFKRNKHKEDSLKVVNDPKMDVYEADTEEETSMNMFQR